MNENPYGNGVAIFTRDGGVARQFQFDVNVGMVGDQRPDPRSRRVLLVRRLEELAVRRPAHLRPRGDRLLHADEGGHEPLAGPGDEQGRPRLPADALVPHIRLIAEDEADGLLQEEYDAAVERAGKVFNILKAMSLNPPVLRASMELYKAIMFGESGLSRKRARAARDRHVRASRAVTTERRRTQTTSVPRAQTTRRRTRDARLSRGEPLAARACALRLRGEADDARRRDRRDRHRRAARGGLRDAEISDAIQVIGYFNYVTRVADGVGIEDEPEWRLGDPGVHEHHSSGTSREWPARGSARSCGDSALLLSREGKRRVPRQAPADHCSGDGAGPPDDPGHGAAGAAVEDVPRVADAAPGSAGAP